MQPATLPPQSATSRHFQYTVSTRIIFIGAIPCAPAAYRAASGLASIPETNALRLICIRALQAAPGIAREIFFTDVPRKTCRALAKSLHGNAAARRKERDRRDQAQRRHIPRSARRDITIRRRCKHRDPRVKATVGPEPIATGAAT